MKKRVKCQICQKDFGQYSAMPSEFVRKSVVDIIKKSNPSWDEKGFICFNDLNSFRAGYVENTLEAHKGAVSELDSEVIKSMKEHEIIAKNVNHQFEGKSNKFDKMSDSITGFVGSWTFIILFFLFLAVWVGINSLQLIYKPFDQYPFILLNLLLSCVAAIQAPIILMSQNRQSKKDRLQSEHDYKVDMKAELEIRHLHAKLDQLLSHQWQRLLEIQQIQMELLAEAGVKKKRK